MLIYFRRLFGLPRVEYLTTSAQRHERELAEAEAYACYYSYMVQYHQDMLRSINDKLEAAANDDTKVGGTD